VGVRLTDRVKVGHTEVDAPGARRGRLIASIVRADLFEFSAALRRAV
jgi:hypothetical protein